MDQQTGNKSNQKQYREYDRILTEQFIGSLNNEAMTNEKFREVALPEDIEEATSEHVLTLACRVEIQRTQRILLDNIKENKELDVNLQNTQKCENETMHSGRCKYCRIGHAYQQCPAYEKNVKNATKPTILRQSTDPHGDNRGTSGPRRQLTKCTRRVD